MPFVYIVPALNCLQTSGLRRSVDKYSAYSLYVASLVPSAGSIPPRCISRECNFPNKMTITCIMGEGGRGRWRVRVPYDIVLQVSSCKCMLVVLCMFLFLFRFHFYYRQVCLNYIQVLGDGVKFVFRVYMRACAGFAVLVEMKFLCDPRRIARRQKHLVRTSLQ